MRLINPARPPPNATSGHTWTLKKRLRDIYRYAHPAGTARRLLRRWITTAKRRTFPPSSPSANDSILYVEAILAAIELGTSNALIEGINAKSA